jgi:hypothetical protein
MAPKKVVAQPAKPKVEVPQSGLMVESCTLPLWDDAENDKEQWGDLSAGHVDPTQQFADPEMPNPPVQAFLTVPGLDWRRPGAVFSPFKPVVFRPVTAGNPYEYVPPASLAGGDAGQQAEDDDDDTPQPQSRSEMIALYRAMKVFRAVGSDDDHGSTRRGQNVAAANKRRDRALAPTPFFMRAFNSALMVINQAHDLLPAGSYAWELIHPQAQGTHIPLYNPNGKYAVKLHFAGAWRRIVIDDRLPTDAFGQCILTVTENKEIWPALLAKAMLKALGPQHESLLFTAPAFAVQTLLAGWAPQHVNPKREEALAFRLVRDGVERMRAHREHVAQIDATIAAATAPGGGAAPAAPPSLSSAPTTPSAGIGRPSGAVMVATCNDTTTANPPSGLVEEHATAAGLYCSQCFYVLDMKPFQNTNLVRLCSPSAAWKGNYGYDNATWTSEVEEALGFSAAKDRNPTDLLRKWNDFWMPWDSFVKFFTTLTALRDTMSKDCSAFRQLTYMSDPPPASAEPVVPAAKGKDKSVSASAAASVIIDTAPRTVTRWVCFNFDTPTNVQFCVTGLPLIRDKDRRPSQQPTPQPSDSNRDSTASAMLAKDAWMNGHAVTTVSVHSYNWRSSDPFAPVLQFRASDGLTNLKTLRVGAGQRAFRVTATDIYNGTITSIMAPSEFSMGDQKEICRDVLGVHTITDAGVFHDHAPNVPTIWFKRFLSAKQPSTTHFILSTLPKGTDLAQYRHVPAEAPAGKGAKPEKTAKPPAKGGKGGPDPAAEASVHELIDDGPHDRPITDFVRLHVIDLDTGAITRDTLGKVMNYPLNPNKAGYMVIARATTPEAYGKGYWRLLCTADKPVDAFEPRAFDEVLVRQGAYQQNDQDTLFRYTVTTGEAATTTVQLVLSDTGRNVPVKLAYYHNDKLIEQKEGNGGAVIEHATLVPSDKAAPNVYAVHCTVDKVFIAQWAGKRREQVVAAFRADTADQLRRLTRRRDEVAALLRSDPTAKIPPMDDAGSSDPSKALHVDSLGFTLSFHSSSTKVDVKEDATVNEAANAIKQQWSRKDDGSAPPPAAKGAKPAKGQPVDESATRFAKAKESRDKFLANRHGVFVPYVNAAGKTILSADQDDNGHRLAAPSPPQPLEIRERLHLGFTADGGSLHGGLDLSKVAEQRTPPRAVAKADAKAELERLQAEVLPAIREERRSAVAAMNEIAQAFMADLKPERPTTEPAPDDDKKKAVGKGGKK